MDRRSIFPARLRLGTALAIALRVAAAHKNPKLRSLPLLHGMFRVSGETIEGPSPSDLLEVFGDDQGDLVLVLVDVHGSVESKGSFLGSMMRETRAALETHEPLHTVVNELEMHLAARPGVEAGLVLLRFSQRDARVEVLNAGMPAIAHGLPGGGLNVHPALSSPVGRHVGEVHPYELVPLVWGATWLAVSDGITGGSLETERIRELAAKLSLAERGMSLAAAKGEVLYDTLQEVMPDARFLRDDATCVFVGADPQKGGRFQSGIDSR